VKAVLQENTLFCSVQRKNVKTEGLNEGNEMGGGEGQAVQFGLKRKGCGAMHELIMSLSESGPFGKKGATASPQNRFRHGTRQGGVAKGTS